MIYLADTNILLRFLYRADPNCPIVRTAVRKLRGYLFHVQEIVVHFAKHRREVTGIRYDG